MEICLWRYMSQARHNSWQFSPTAQTFKAFLIYHLHPLMRREDLSFPPAFYSAPSPGAPSRPRVSDLLHLFFEEEQGTGGACRSWKRKWTYLAHATKINMKSPEPPAPLEPRATCHFLLLDTLIFASSKNKALDVKQQLPQEIIHSFHCCRL